VALRTMWVRLGAGRKSVPESALWVLVDSLSLLLPTPTNALNAWCADLLKKILRNSMSTPGDQLVHPYDSSFKSFV
jgi:hypothetical protein